MAKVGRPAQGNTAKNAPLNMRTSPELRALIEAAAEATGRSLTQEVERRLITSFIFDDSRGGPHIGAFANMVCAVIQNIELDRGHRWTDDFDTYTMVRGAIERLVRWRHPGTSPEVEQLSAEVKDAEETWEEAREALVAFRKRHMPEGGQGLGGVIMSALGHHPTKPNWREELSPEVRAEEAKLEIAERLATDEYRTKRAELDKAWQPYAERMRACETAGEQMADAVFDDIGPRS